MSWSRSLTEVLTRQARSVGLRPGDAASAWTISNSRRALSTIRPGIVSRQAASTFSFRFSLRCRLWGLAFGATDSSSGMTDNDRQRRDSPLKKATSPHFRRNAEIPEPEELTHKGIYGNVALPI